MNNVTVLRPTDNWRGELRYCSRLCRMRGNADVPRSMLGGYLDLQRVQARRAGRPEVAAAFTTACRQYEEGRHREASFSLEQAAVGLDARPVRRRSGI